MTLYVLLYCISQTVAQALPWHSGSCIKAKILIHAYPFERSSARYLIGAYCGAHTVRSTHSCSCRPCLHKIKQVRGSAVHAIIHASASVHGRLVGREEKRNENGARNGLLTAVVWLFSDSHRAQEMHHDVHCHTWISSAIRKDVFSLPLSPALSLRADSPSMHLHHTSDRLGKIQERF